MSYSKCSSVSLRPKTREESDICLIPLEIGRDGGLAEVPLFSAIIAVDILKILRGSAFMNDNYYPRLPPSPYFRLLSGV